jgi:hypothetical protein
MPSIKRFQYFFNLEYSMHPLWHERPKEAGDEKKDLGDRDTDDDLAGDAFSQTAGGF